MDPNTSLTNPFAGQNIGYLRLAVVGDSGVGKTSFARQFTETLPEVFAHDWDPIDALQEDYTRTSALEERFSSTKMEIPWDNMDADDEVPAKNLVFIDTPGYGSSIDAKANFDMFNDYLTMQFDKMNQKVTPFLVVSPAELMRSLVTGTGSHQFVDVCFYLIVHRLKPIDVEYMRMISGKANVVPVIAKVDTQSEQEVIDLKVHVLKTLKEQGVSIYSFRIDHDRLLSNAQNGIAGGPPFAISNVDKPTSDKKEDQLSFTPAQSELALLRKLVLETHITNIRQFTVKKFINWRSKQEPSPQQLQLQQQQQQHLQQQMQHQQMQHQQQLQQQHVPASLASYQQQQQQHQQQYQSQQQLFR